MTPDDLSQLVPAFVGAALVILVVAVGILIFVWRQYPPARDAEPRREPRVDPERLSVKRGLRSTGFAVLALGIVCLCAGGVFGQAVIFGPASLLVEVAVTADGIVFLIASQRFSSKA